MFEGTRARIQLFIPDKDTPASRPEFARVDDDAAEFDDVSYLDLDGDPYIVVRGTIDIVGATVRYETLQGGRFADVDDEDGFNGYKLTLLGIREDEAVSLRGARIVDHTNTLGLEAEDIDAKGATIWADVDGLPFSTGDGFDLRLDLKFKGDRGRDVFTGAEGRDVLLGFRGSDVLNGADGRDRLVGGGGRDLLDGGDARDVLIGGRGADTFVLGTGRARDKVRDFEDGRDHILVTGNADRFGDLDLIDHRRGTVVATEDASILLIGVDESDLGRDDFLF